MRNIFEKSCAGLDLKMEGFSTQVILAKVQAVVEGGYSPDVGIVIDLLRTNESISASMTPVASQEQAGLYMYRFQVPVGDFYRFRLSSRLSPVAVTRHQSLLSSSILIDYAISRAAAKDGICTNHFQPLANGNELHLGEADYLALLAKGQCACTTTTTTGDHLVDRCSWCQFDNTFGKEVGDVPANTGLKPMGAFVSYGRLGLDGDLAWPQHFEQRRCASEELPQENLDEQEASFPEPDRPATGLDALRLRLSEDHSAGMGRHSVENKDDFQEAAKWSGMCASGEDGDCLQRRFRQKETKMLPKPSDKEEEEEELERDTQLACHNMATTHYAWSNDSLGFEDAGFRIGWSAVGTGADVASAGDEPWSSAVRPDSVLASAGDEPWGPAVRPDSVLASAGDEPWGPAVRPDSVLASAGDEPWAPAFRLDSVLASAGDEPWSSAVRPDSVFASVADESWLSAAESKDDARETYVFERCQRNCVHASGKENILFAVFDNGHTFLLPPLNERFRRSLCFSTLPLPSDVVRDLLKLISGETDSEPHRLVDVSDSHPLLPSPVETSDSELSGDFANAVQPHDLTDSKQSSCTSTRHDLLSEASEVVVASSSSSATGATAVETEDVEETRCGVSESYKVDFDFEMRLGFWRRAKRAVIQVLQRISCFFRGLFRGRGRARRRSSSRRGLPSHPSWTKNAEREDRDNSSKA